MDNKVCGKKILSNMKWIMILIHRFAGRLLLLIRCDFKYSRNRDTKPVTLLRGQSRIILAGLLGRREKRRRQRRLRQMRSMIIFPHDRVWRWSFSTFTSYVNDPLKNRRMTTRNFCVLSWVKGVKFRGGSLSLGQEYFNSSGEPEIRYFIHIQHN